MHELVYRTLVEASFPRASFSYSLRMRKICLIDYDQGNIGSVFHGFRRLGREVKIASSPGEVPDEVVLVLPGVGSFDSGVRRLKEKNWDRFLLEWHSQANSLIGICLGMQLLSLGSDEGGLSGLGIFRGQCKVNPSSRGSGVRVPNLGWRQIASVSGSVGSSLIASENRFYFSHSYHYVPEDHQDTVATVDYGSALPAVILKNRTLGIQFHPEKSQQHGMEFLRNALAILDV